METKYFKKDQGYIAWYMSVEKDESGFDVMVDNSGKMASVKKSPCQVVIEGYKPCTEGEFNNAFERAISAITSGMLVAA